MVCRPADWSVNLVQEEVGLILSPSAGLELELGLSLVMMLHSLRNFFKQNLKSIFQTWSVSNFSYPKKSYNSGYLICQYQRGERRKLGPKKDTQQNFIDDIQLNIQLNSNLKCIIHQPYVYNLTTRVIIIYHLSTISRQSSPKRTCSVRLS